MRYDGYSCIVVGVFVTWYCCDGVFAFRSGIVVGVFAVVLLWVYSQLGIVVGVFAIVCLR